MVKYFLKNPSSNILLHYLCSTCLLNEFWNVWAILKTEGRKVIFCVQTITLYEDQGVPMDQYIGWSCSRRDYMKTLKRKWYPRAWSQIVLDQLSMFSSVNLSNFSFHFYWGICYNDIDEMIQETNMSYLWSHSLLESSIVCLLSELEEFFRS